MHDRNEGIKKIRAIADALERGDEVAVLIGWSTPDGRLATMSFGHQVIVDALLVHTIRVSVKHGAVEQAPQ